ncbi:hypothetical protein BGW37DRAFT_483063 [Umbelopsis sp. PMI_123]|nr:hypothetical protein BGW37DRAFT_483063 [Umbelopsis sp. PMI_123]
MTESAPKSLNFRKPTTLMTSNSICSFAHSRTLSRLKSDGHTLLARFSGPLRRSKSQHGSLAFSSSSIGEIRNNADLKLQTEQILESDSRYELSRYRRRREQTQSLVTADLRMKRRKESAHSDDTDENDEPMLTNTEYGEKSKWLSGIQSCLSLRRLDGCHQEKQHKKSKSVPTTTTTVYTISNDTIAEVSTTFYYSRSGILVKGQAIKSMFSSFEQNHSATSSPTKPEQRERKRCQSSFISNAEYQRNAFCPSTTNITVNSEDLTAREFADMTGIRICSDNENIEDNLVVDHCSTPQRTNALCHEDFILRNNSMWTPNATVYSNHITVNSFGGHSRTSSTFKKPQIWEQQFWENSDDLLATTSSLISLQHQKGDQIQQGSQQLPKSKSVQLELYSRSECDNHRRTDSSPILSIPSTYGKSLMINQQEASNNLPYEDKNAFSETIRRLIKSGKPTVVRKGRFEIIYGGSTKESLPLSKLYPPDVPSASLTTFISDEQSNILLGQTIEWKRKKCLSKE